MPNLTSVTVTNGVPTAGSGTVSTLDNLVGTAGTPSANVQSVQGVAGGTAVPVSGTVSVNALPTGSNTIGAVEITDGTNGNAAVKPASTAPVATDKALVVGISPNSPGIITTGTAGSPSAQVLSVQGISGGTPVPSLPALTAAGNGMTSSRVNSAASTNATSLKASAGNIAAISVFNTAAYTVFLKLYNKASAPTVGTDTPVWTIPIAAGGGFAEPMPVGESFSTGIAYAITKLQADSDTTAVVAGDLTGRIKWI